MGFPCSSVGKWYITPHLDCPSFLHTSDRLLYYCSKARFKNTTLVVTACCFIRLMLFVAVKVKSVITQGFPGGSVVKNLPANAGDSRDMGLIPGWGRSPGVGNG